jgi:hypothetical protein
MGIQPYRSHIAAICIPNKAPDKQKNTNQVGINLYRNRQTLYVNLSGIILTKMYDFFQSECEKNPTFLLPNSATAACIAVGPDLISNISI